VKAFFIGVFVVIALSASIAKAEWEILVDLEPDTIGNLEVDRPDLRCYNITID
jgi:hypothetical protein